MSVRTTLLAALDYIRTTIPGPTSFDVRPTSVSIQQWVWSNGLRGSGARTVVQVATLPAGTKVRHVTQREIANSGGRYESGDVRVGPITPTYAATGALPAGGFTEQQLDPPVAAQGVENVYVLALQAGASGISGEYQLLQLERDRALHMSLVLRKRRTTPGTAAAPVLP